jgi:hypothetical protein
MTYKEKYLQMTSKNDITGDWIKSKPHSKQFDENFDRIFGKKEKTKLPEYELDKSTGEVIKKNENT